MVAQIPMIKKPCAHILNILNTQCSNGHNLDSLLGWNHSSKCLVDSNVCLMFNVHCSYTLEWWNTLWKIWNSKTWIHVHFYSFFTYVSIRHSPDTTLNCSSTSNWLMNFKQILLPWLLVTIKSPWLLAWTDDHNPFNNNFASGGICYR